MKRFGKLNFAAVAMFFAIGWRLGGTTRLWVFTAFWIIYLTIVGCGVAFIQMQLFCPAICRGRKGAMRVALTFDDGPDPASTPALLDLLKAERISAVFFCIGERVAAHPEIAARIVADGHLIGNHTYRHRWYTAMMMGSALSREIGLTQDAIREATGATPAYMRPPVGMTNPHYRAVLNRAGLAMAGWDVRSLDTRQTPRRAIDRVLRQTRDGSIILLHDGGMSPDAVIEIASDVIAGLRKRGFDFDRMDRLAGAAHLAAPVQPRLFTAETQGSRRR